MSPYSCHIDIGTYGAWVLRCKLMHCVIDIPWSIATKFYSTVETDMNECKLVKEKESGMWQVVVYDVTTKQVVSTSPHYKDRDRAIEFAKSNFAHLCDTTRIKE